MKEILNEIWEFIKIIFEVCLGPIIILFYAWTYRGNIYSKKQFVARVIWVLFASTCLIGGLIIGIMFPLMGYEMLIAHYYTWSLISGIPLIVCAVKYKIDKISDIIKENRHRGFVEVKEYTVDQNASNSFEVSERTKIRDIGHRSWFEGDGCLTIILKGAVVFFAISFLGVFILSYVLIRNVKDIIDYAK